MQVQEAFDNMKALVDAALLNKQDRVAMDQSLQTIAMALNENINLKKKLDVYEKAEVRIKLPITTPDKDPEVMEKLTDEK